MEIKIKKLNPDAVIPFYAKPGDACMDLTATSCVYEENKGFIYGFGIALEIPEGYEVVVRPRSSSCEVNAVMCPPVGTIDSGYRGEISVVFKNLCPNNLKPPFEVGERVAQMKVQEVIPINFVEVEELSKSERGTNGYGSTGK